LQFTCDTIDTDSKAVTKECVDELMRGEGVVVGGGAERRGDEDGETKGERSEVGLVERGLTTDQATQVVEG
jgi:hypothetical protein